MGRIVISPTGVVNFPGGGGHFWVFRQYLHGLQELGCEVYWLERFHSTGDSRKDSQLISEFKRRMQELGMDGRLLLYTQCDGERDYIGWTRDQAEKIFGSADLLVNFNYSIEPSLLACFRRTALLDIDPGLLQFWVSVGQLSIAKHDRYLTTGETVGKSELIPDCGLDWVYMRPPVSLSQWPYYHDPGCEAFTTVSSWWGGYGRGEWVTDGDSHVYENNKRVFFLQFVELPRHTGETIELALMLGDGDPVDQRALAPPEWKSRKACPEDITDYTGDAKDRWVLESYGWRVRNSGDVAGSPEQYRDYIRNSRGEFSCVKPSCVRLQNAWVSDRSLCYLATGKPVVVQDTGPSSFLPNGEGMFRFSTMQEAVEAFASIRADYSRHSRAAREIAEAFFDARRGLETILNFALDSSAATAAV